MFSGKSYQARFNTVAYSKLKCKDWCRARLNGSRRLFGYLSENFNCSPPKWKNDDQQEDGCRNNIWDPGIQEDQFWELKTCEELHQSLGNLLGDVRDCWKSKRWWKFQDEFKHKPP
ncbi:hypothetical protein AHAS_Ahas16G0161200 [Arachis hypogaea]